MTTKCGWCEVEIESGEYCDEVCEHRAENQASYEALEDEAYDYNR